MTPYLITKLGNPIGICKLFQWDLFKRSFMLYLLGNYEDNHLKLIDYPQNSPDYYKNNIVAKYKHRGTEVQSMDNNVLIIKDLAEELHVILQRHRDLSPNGSVPQLITK